MIAAISAVAANGMIGRDHWLPWDIPEELAYFEATVDGAALVIGRLTYASMDVVPADSFIVTRQPDLPLRPGCHACATVEEALRRALATGKAVFVLGGASIYAAAWPYCQRFYLTRIAAASIAAAKPLLGVCLGHQAIALAAGAGLARAEPMHGKTDRITHDGSGLFDGLPSPLTMTRYHSLVAERVPDSLHVTAHGSDGTVQALAHRAAPVHGVQFHPESIASQAGLGLLANFLRLSRQAA